MSLRGKLRHFLGFLVSQRAIKMVPGQIQAISEMQRPTTKKEIQFLTKTISGPEQIYLVLFTPFAAFLQGTKRVGETGWGPECDEAFRAIKEYIASPLSLSQPVDGEELYLYLSSSAIAVSAALVKLDSYKR